jgi:hypothetical protein
VDVASGDDDRSRGAEAGDHDRGDSLQHAALEGRGGDHAAADRGDAGSRAAAAEDGLLERDSRHNRE